MLKYFSASQAFDNHKSVLFPLEYREIMKSSICLSFSILITSIFFVLKLIEIVVLWFLYSIY